jgi:hypothetical protein
VRRTRAELAEDTARARDSLMAESEALAGRITAAILERRPK